METEKNVARPIPLSEVKNTLKKVSKERKELLYEQKIALEHVNKFSKLTLAKTKDMIKELTDIESVQEVHAIKITDLLPKTEDDVKTIFAKERLTIGEKEIKKILDIVAKYNTE